jgi:hypothetical protein
MENYKLINDIGVVFIKVPTFPNDVPSTFEKLNAAIPYHPQRRFFGISHPDQTGKIQYKAAAEIFAEETFETNDLQKFTIQKGDFSANYIVNHMEDSNSIGRTFQALLQDPRLDRQGYCLEMYKNYTDPDVFCMVRLKS